MVAEHKEYFFNSQITYNMLNNVDTWHSKECCTIMGLFFGMVSLCTMNKIHSKSGKLWTYYVLVLGPTIILHSGSSDTAIDY